ncbi:MAG TPA: phosphatase PAP2 family protein [Solirubrobacteraceae bacterium]|nr:phosphatase PAP2 family protein [Solirubrobacteraceae bacterium]
MSARPAPEPGATRSLRARLAAGPLVRRIALADLRISTFVRTRLDLPHAHGPIKAYTTAGEHAALWYAIGTVAMLRADPATAARWRRAMLSVFVTQLVNTAVKTVFRRRRPLVEDLPALVKVPTSLSFPSAHSSTSFCAARTYSALAPGRAPLLYGAAAAMAASRVYVGVHYPTDIAVGAALGTAIGSVAR